MGLTEERLKGLGTFEGRGGQRDGLRKNRI